MFQKDIKKTISDEKRELVCAEEKPCKELETKISFKRDASGEHRVYTAQSRLNPKFTVDNQNWIVALVNSYSSDRGSLPSYPGHSLIVVEGVRLEQPSVGGGLYESSARLFVGYYQLHRVSVSSGSAEESSVSDVESYFPRINSFDHHHFSRVYRDGSMKVWPMQSPSKVNKMIAAIEASKNSEVMYSKVGKAHFVNQFLNDRDRDVISRSYRWGVLSRSLRPDERAEQGRILVFPSDHVSEKLDEKSQSSSEASVCGYAFCSPSSEAVVVRGSIPRNGLDGSVLANINLALSRGDDKLLEDKTKQVLLEWMMRGVERHNCASWAIEYLRIAGITEETTLLDKIIATKPKNHVGNESSCMLL